MPLVHVCYWWPFWHLNTLEARHVCRNAVVSAGLDTQVSRHLCNNFHHQVGRACKIKEVLMVVRLIDSRGLMTLTRERAHARLHNLYIRWAYVAQKNLN